MLRIECAVTDFFEIFYCMRQNTTVEKAANTSFTYIKEVHLGSFLG